MKHFLCLSILALMVSVTAVAATNEIKINSWQRINRDTANDNAAEVCGSVTGTLTGSEKILLTVDSGMYTSEYMTLLSPKGNFCHVVNTYLGKIRADLLSGTNLVINSIELKR